MQPVSICGYHIRESGSTPVQEIAYAFEIARAYIEEVQGRGLKADEFVGSFFLQPERVRQPLEQIAKFRAAASCGQDAQRGVRVTEKKTYSCGVVRGGGSGLTKASRKTISCAARSTPWRRP